MSAEGAEPLRIGVLGAARIAAESVVDAARTTGHRLVAVAARDPRRAADFARSGGVERVVASYAELVADGEVEVVYNPLPNALHAPWNLEAVRAGRHVLTEKPSASTAAQAREVADAARAAGVSVVEGFHYLHHPVFARLRELAASGELGEAVSVEADVLMPAPPGDDVRWSRALAGGALMDLGCYGLHAARHLADWAGGAPSVRSARAVEHPEHPGVDAELVAELAHPGGVVSRVRARMAGDQWRFALRLVGADGTAEAANFIKPQLDDSVTVTTRAGERVEHPGTRSSYAHQLDALAAHLRGGAPLATDAEDAVATMELIDACYLAAGLPLREVVTT